MSKEVLASDIDEVLFPFVAEFAPWHNDLYGTDLSVEDFHSYEFEGVIDVSVSEIVNRVHAFLEQEHRHIHVGPIDQAQESVKRLSEEFELVFVTARHPSFQSITEEYLEEYFSGVSDKLYLIGHAANMDIVKTKAAVCKEIGAKALIDDSYAHLAQCPPENIEGVLFGNYAWNRNIKLEPGIVRAKNWQEVTEHFGVQG